MYSANIKVGSSIAVCGCRPGIGTSSTAAMVASMLAARGEKVLLLSTDAAFPYDAVSLLSDDIENSHMDELVVLENSTGVTPENLGDYITAITSNLCYIRASARLDQLTNNAAKTLNHVIDAACYDFRYVVIDIGYNHSPYSAQITEAADLILYAVGQDKKSIESVRSFYSHDGFGEDSMVLTVVPNCENDVYASAARIAKRIGADEVFPLYHSAEWDKAVYTRNIAGFAYKAVKRRKQDDAGFFSKLFGRKKEAPPSEDEAKLLAPDGEEAAEEEAASAENYDVVDGLANICELITAALVPEEEGD